MPNGAVLMAERATMRHGDRARGAWDMRNYTPEQDRCRMQQLKIRDYLEAVEPIAQERLKIANRCVSLAYCPATGETVRNYSARDQFLDDMLAERIKTMQRAMLGSEATYAGQARDLARERNQT